jgi:branched-chain amino acid transport system substrate-binding protein
MHRRWPRILALSMGIPLILAFLAACGPGTNSTDTQGVVTIKIGSDFPTSQADASSGKPAEEGVRYAIDQANKTNFLPGYNFVIDARDDVGLSGTYDQGVGKDNVDKLIADAQVSAIVGPFNSSVAKAEMPDANNAGIALISPSNSNNCLTQETPADECGGANSLITKLRPTGKVTYFRTATLDQYQGGALAKFAYVEKGYSTAYVIDNTGTYGAGLATNFIKAFEKYGGTIVDHKSIKSATSYEDVLTAVAAAKPDVLFFGGEDSTGGITIRQQMANVHGLENLPFLGGDGIKTRTFAQSIAPQGGGPVYGSIPSAASASKEFETNFLNTYHEIGAYSAGAYDDAQIVLNAIKKVIQDEKVLPPKNSKDMTTAQTFRRKVIDAIQNTDYSGLTGHHTFDKNGDTTNRSISVFTMGDVNVSDGWTYVEGIDVSKL